MECPYDAAGTRLGGGKNSPLVHTACASVHARQDHSAPWVPNPYTGAWCELGCNGMSVRRCRDDVGWLDRNVKPLLQENDVAFLLCGHDHDQQHITDGSVVDYVVSGGGHDIRCVCVYVCVRVRVCVCVSEVEETERVSEREGQRERERARERERKDERKREREGGRESETEIEREKERDRGEELESL